MDEQPPEVIDRWVLFCADNPLPDSWNQTATIASEIYHATQWVAARSGATLDHRPIDHWIPSQKAQNYDHSRSMTAQQSQQWFERQVGLKT